MNLLAHLHLSDGSPGSMLGGVVADLVKPPQVAALPGDVQEGVRLHRLIDAFTDRHPLVQGSIGRIAAEWTWFSGIIIDIYYDHILARNWTRYSTEPLEAFADRCYDALDAGRPLVPPEAADFLLHFIEDDRLVKYATVKGIEDTLARVSNRIGVRMPRNAVRLEEAMPDLLAKDAHLADDFHAFYPELIAFAEGVKAEPPG
ncbi:MAG TPA: acyl carrier protein phosphodiesterase [Gemmataceae bacterium]|nr:acyl carrier protein phosphodiesterase [Gemmataceae bacterium]